MIDYRSNLHLAPTDTEPALIEKSPPFLTRRLSFRRPDGVYRYLSYLKNQLGGTYESLYNLSKVHLLCSGGTLFIS